MIVSGIPRVAHAWKDIGKPLIGLFLWDIAVTILWFGIRNHVDWISFQFSLFGTGIALFLGFAVNAAYARWWEARTLWGGIVNASRTLARQSVTLLDAPSSDGAIAHRIGVDIVHNQIAYAHVLRTSLRGQELPIEAQLHLSPARYARLQQVSNPSHHLLISAGGLIQEAKNHGLLDSITQVRLEATLVDLSNAQGGLERIRNTPLPVQYRFFPALFARLFCLILPFAVVPDLGVVTPIGSTLVGLMFLMALQAGLDLADPFTDGVYDVPMTTICRTIEIDLLETLGEPAPEKVAERDSVLW